MHKMPDGKYEMIMDYRLCKLSSKEMELKVTEKQFCDSLKGYKLDEALIALSDISQKLFDPKFQENKYWRKEKTGFIINKFNKQFITEFAVEYIANLFLISGSNKYKNLSIKDKDNLLGVFNIYYNCLMCPDIKVLGENFLIPLSFQQFASQQDFKDTLTRQMLLFNEIHNNYDENGANYIDLNKILKEIIGISIKDYISIIFFILVIILEKPYFSIGNLADVKEESLKKILTTKNLDIIFNFLSATPAELRKIDQLRNSNLNPVYTKSRYNPLWEKPIVKLSHDTFVVPSMNAYKKGAIMGLYWFFENKLGKKFRDYFGRLFEDYGGEIIKDIYGEDNVEKGRLYGRKEKKEFIDWVVKESEDNYLFFELKAYQLSLYALQTGDIEQVGKEILKKVVGTIKQMYKRVQDINNYPELYKYKNKKYQCIAIFYNMSFISTDMYKKYIKKSLEELEETLPGITNFEYTLMSIDELEDYKYIKDFISFEKLIEEVKNDKSINLIGQIRKVYRENGLDPKLVRNFLDKNFDESFVEGKFYN